MTRISVRRLSEVDGAAHRLLEEIAALEGRIRRRAYDSGQARAAVWVSPVDDWLVAEREICWVPQAKLQETDLAVHLMIELAEVADETIEVTMLPQMVILRGAGAVEDDSHRRAPFEAAPKVLLRRISFPAQVHAESSVVRLENDFLKLSAAKVDPA